MDVPELFKADAVTGAIMEKLAMLKSKVNPLAPKNFFSTDIVWDMTKDEIKAVAEFLVSQHTPSTRSVKAEQTIVEAYVKPTSMQQSGKTFVPKVGAPCPECGQQKLIRKSINRSDGTETDFLACQGYPDSCKAIFPLVAVVRQTTPSYEVIEISATKPIGEGMPCPKCSTGKKIRRKGKNGKPDFFGCSNYGKLKCGFTEQIN